MIKELPLTFPPNEEPCLSLSSKLSPRFLGRRGFHSARARWHLGLAAWPLVLGSEPGLAVGRLGLPKAQKWICSFSPQNGASVLFEPPLHPSLSGPHTGGSYRRFRATGCPILQLSLCQDEPSATVHGDHWSVPLTCWRQSFVIHSFIHAVPI